MTIYQKWLDRKDMAVANAQSCIDDGNNFMAEYWSNQANFCDLMLNKIINMTADKWLEMEVYNEAN